MLDIKILRGREQIEALSHDWRALAQTCELFVDYDWLRIWMQSFATGAEDEIVILRATRASRLVAVLPLVKRRARWRQMPVRMLRLCTNQHSPYGGGTIAAEDRHRTIAALADAVSAMSDWDVLELSGIRVLDATGIHLMLRMLAKHIGAPYRVEYQFVLPLDADWERYYNGLSTNFRTNLRRTERKLAERGPVSIEVFTGPDRIDEGFAALLNVDSQSWKSTAGETISSDADLSRYYHGVASAYGAEGRAWVTVVKAGDLPVAAVLAFEHNGAAYAVKASTLSSVESGTISPGHFALIQVIEAACRRGLRQFHFLSGADAWKRYGGDLEPVVSARCFARSAYGGVIAALDRIAGTVRPATLATGAGSTPHIIR